MRKVRERYTTVGIQPVLILNYLFIVMEHETVKHLFTLLLFYA